MPIQQMLLGTGGTVTAEPGQVDLAPGTTSWTVPAGVTSVSVVCIGRGGIYQSGHGGGGGGLAYGNNIAVTPGAVISVSVPDEIKPSNRPTSSSNNVHAYFNSTSVLVAYSGYNESGGGTAGSAKTAGYNGGDGGAAYSSWGTYMPAGGGGAAGYTGDGGDGGAGGSNNGYSGSGDGAGGGAGNNTTTACSSGGGGGGSYTWGHVYSTDLSYYGGNNAGVGGSGPSCNPGGQGQVNSTTKPYAGTTKCSWGHPMGGGGAGVLATCNNDNYGQAGRGAVRIMWPGDTRSYPNTNVADV